MEDQKKEKPEEKSSPEAEPTTKAAEAEKEAGATKEDPKPKEDDSKDPKPEETPVDKTIKRSRLRRFGSWYKSHKKISIPLSVLFLLVIIGVIPWSRYHTVGLVYKKDFIIQAIDSTTSSPVSGAQVNVGNVQAITDENGKATLHLPVGTHTFTLSKKYYQNSQASALVPIFSEKKIPAISMQATGRQVKITVKNTISKKALAGVTIEIADIEAKTDDSGNASVVLPAGTMSQKAKLSLSGYNDATVTVQVSNTEVKQNDFTITPSGKVYFLSKRTGTIDVMKSDLDGKNAKVVLAGTGNEQASNTVLSASADWKYIALIAKRNANDPSPQLYIISAADDKLLTADSGNADFGITGWIGNNLIYSVDRNEIPAWQANKYRLKSYDASSGKITLLNQTSAAGNSSGYGYEYYANVLISGNTVVYIKDWSYVYDETMLNGKKNTVSEISASGQNHRVVASYDAKTNTMSYVQHEPNALYIWKQADNPANSQFLDYVVGSSPKQISLTENQFYQRYPTYYWESSGNRVFWSDLRDGKNTLMVADSTGANAKTVLTQADYEPFSWFGSQYLLVSKDESELYIMPASGGVPLKITNYQQAQMWM